MNFKNTFKKISSYNVIFWPILILIIIAFFLLFERIGLVYHTPDNVKNLIENSVALDEKNNKTYEIESLIIYDSTAENGEKYFEHSSYILKAMSVGFESVDISKDKISDLAKFQTVIIATPDIDNLANDIFKICDWVKEGGKCMFYTTPNPNVTFRSIASRLGVADGGTEYAAVHGMVLQPGFMIGSEEGFEFPWEEPAESVLNLKLESDCEVYIVSNDENKVPMLWSKDYGEGRFVVSNHGICEKITRGLMASTYSLLQDHFAYPVINASVFFLDDFPSPVPLGDGEYIKQFYGRDISSFYTNIWWPDMIELSSKYGVKYTGLTIENYSDNVTAPFTRNMDSARFKYFGGMLLEKDGEVGIHGYNHMPLCLDGFDFMGKVDYKTWPSYEAMEESVSELIDFTQLLFPDAQISCYVPPSNILSKEGRQLLGDKFPQIKTISGLYFVENYEYEQEFEIAQDGKIELPRIISGTQIDYYTKWSAINELNFHYVNTHFMHPDDTLDVDRGAANGWQSMKNNLEEYIKWLYSSANGIRNLTASQASAAVQRYDVLTVNRKTEDNKYILSINNFHDEAYFIVRLSGNVKSVDGGTIQRTSEKSNIYILSATSSNVTIELES